MVDFALERTLLVYVAIMTSSRTQAVGGSYLSSIQNSSRNCWVPLANVVGTASSLQNGFPLIMIVNRGEVPLLVDAFLGHLFRQGSISFVALYGRKA